MLMQMNRNRQSVSLLFTKELNFPCSVEVDIPVGNEALEEIK